MLFSIGMTLAIVGIVLVKMEFGPMLNGTIRHLTDGPEPASSVVGVILFLIGIILVVMSFLILAWRYLP